MKHIYKEDYQKLIKRLRDMRLKAGLTQNDVAKALGKPQSFIAKYEKGERRLDIIELKEIAKILKVDIGELILE